MAKSGASFIACGSVTSGCRNLLTIGHTEVGLSLSEIDREEITNSIDTGSPEEWIAERFWSYFCA